VLNQTAFMTLTYHAMGVVLSWACALIRFDRQALPQRLLIIGAVMLVVPMLVMPSLGIVTWRLGQSEEQTLSSPGVLEAVARLITALAAAGLAARSLARVLFPQADLKLSPLGQDTRRLVDLMVILAVPSIVVGWQALPMVIFIAAMMAVLGRRFFPRSDVLGCLALAMPWALVIQLVLWRASLGWAWWPGEGSDPWVILLWAFVVLTLPTWLKERPPKTADADSAPSIAAPDDLNDVDPSNDVGLPQDDATNPNHQRRSDDVIPDVMPTDDITAPDTEEE